MPAPMFIDQLDDEVAFEINNNFSGGQVSNARAMLLADNQAAALTNIDVTLSGEATTRRGSVGLGSIVGGGGNSNPAGIQGMFWYSTSTNEYLVAVNKHKLYKWTGGAWSEISPGTWTSTDDNAMTHFAQLSSKLYFCNGTCNLFSWDGTTMVDLGHAANQPPANAKLVVEHTNRLVVCGSGADRNTLYFSQFLDGTLFDPLWSLQVGDHNDEIIALKSWSDFNLLVFKRHGIYAINCDPSLQLQDPNNSIAYFEIKPIHQQLGCVAPESVQQIGNDVYFLSSHGVYSINKIIASGSTQEIGPDLSYPIHDYIDRINVANASKCAAIGYGNKYMLSFPLDSATAPNTIMVWNDSLGCWTGLWTGWNASCFAYCSPATGNLLRFGTNSGGGLVKEWLDYVAASSETTSTFQDSGTDIPSIVLTRSYTFGGITNKKTGYSVRADFYNSLANCTLQTKLDRQDPVTLASIPSSGGVGIVFPFAFPKFFPAIKTYKAGAALQSLGQFTEIQHQVTSTAGKLNLLSMATSAWLDTLDSPV